LWSDRLFLDIEINERAIANGEEFTFHHTANHTSDILTPATDSE
jgi:hypothetical protein